jgi:HAD superfamily phosphoserine phosphatase-like hydrolase
MNGYDFDKTIYDGDSFTHFYVFTLLRRPFLIFTLPLYIIPLVLFLLGRIGKKQVKQLLMINLVFYKNRQKIVTKFWDKHIKRIKPWYFNLQQKNDLVISASPTFLVKEACIRIGIQAVIATDMNLSTLKIEGKNCYGEAKVEKFEQQFGKTLLLGAFYSDSLSDMPMMKKSKQGILVTGDKLEVIYKQN